jgi:thiaminase/transcriptional activator TenA
MTDGGVSDAGHVLDERALFATGYCVSCQPTPDDSGRGSVANNGTNRPVEVFCSALRRLQRESGLSPTTLARQLNYSRSQLYVVLDGRIRRPPDWNRTVEPLVRACLKGRLNPADLERAVAAWRQRHDALLSRQDELDRRGKLAEIQPDRGTSTSRTLLASSWLWPRLAAHPFVRSVAHGDLSDAVFRRWMVNDHYYNVEYQRFIAGLAGIATTDAARESLATAISGSRLGLLEIRRLADEFLIDLTAEPESATVGLAAYLQAQVSRGYEASLTALYAAEMVYFDTWSAIASDANRSTPYWHLLEDWSSTAYEKWIVGLGQLLDAAAVDGPSPEMRRVFDWVTRWELLFWDGVLAGDTW